MRRRKDDSYYARLAYYALMLSMYRNGHNFSKASVHGGVILKPSELNIHSFIIKVWLEETAPETGSAIWRGRITHVSSGYQQFIINLQDIIHFIRPFMEKMGVDPEEL